MWDACTGRRTFIVRGGGESKSATLEVWGGGRLLKELAVPKTLHGGVYNDGWFGAGAAWSPDESRLAYVAEVTRLRLQKMTSSCGENPRYQRRMGLCQVVRVKSLRTSTASCMRCILCETCLDFAEGKSNVPSGLHGGHQARPHKVAVSRELVVLPQAPPAKQTPSWGDTKLDGKASKAGNGDAWEGDGKSGGDKPATEEGAAPKTWRGIGEWQVGAKAVRCWNF